MIKISKKECPKELTEELKKKLTEKFALDGSSIWKLKFIEEALLESSYGKCAYCECKVDRESKYMEVEHFHDKKTYPEEVINWENLLPSCKRCNGHKSTFDTKVNPFINPTTMDPKNHLILNSFRFYPLTKAGENTIEELLLNDSKRLVVQRFEITEAVIFQLENIYTDTLEYKTGVRKHNRNKKRILSCLESLLSEALPSSPYSATVATALVNNSKFIIIVDILIQEKLWNDTLDCLLKQIQTLSLDTNIKKTLDYMKSVSV
ncbi:HNH endonuclease [Neobacillus sp. LXY-4]|uniref:HNH endonuclease n=1 Tax=Neobacillus sp. LXY-4 TaxID=3379826 RepID=UPI003EE05183